MKLAQLTDLHLTGKTGIDVSYQKFLACLALAINQSPDFLLLTGDLVNNGTQDGYDWLFHTLNSTAIPYACLAGNHDVTLEIGHELPYTQRQFLPIDKNNKLIEYQRILLGNYQLLCLNSAVAGKEYGTLSTPSLDWLHQTLSQFQQPTLIALHHHPVPVGSTWIDKLMLKNSNELFQVLAHFSHIKAILCGHVHQAHTLKHQGIKIFTTPATSRQFLPFCDEFQLDMANGGIRILELGTTINSAIFRI